MQDLNALIQKGGPIFVRNETDPAGDIVLDFGPGVKCPIPPGPDPINLTGRVPLERIKNCADLFTAIGSQKLVLVDPKDAEKYYVDHADRKKIVEDKIRQFMTKEPVTDASPRAVTLGTGSADTSLAPWIISLCVQCKEARLTERDALEQLLTREKELSVESVEYVKLHGRYDGVKKWASERLSNMLGHGKEITKTSNK